MSSSRAHHRSRIRGLVLLLLALVGCSGSDDPARQPAAIAGGLRLSSVLGAGDDAGYARARRGRRLSFPADHGAHPDFRSEWWYLTLMLEDDDGNDYGGQFTLFRQALAPPLPDDAAASDGALASSWETRQIYMAHLAVTDVAAGRHHSSERFSRGNRDLAAVRNVPFIAFIDDWQLAATGSGAALLPLRLEAQAERFGWSLALERDKPLVLQGEAGYSAKGPGQASHYYSYPRLAVTGELRLGTRTIAVQGSGWFDREWSTSVLSAAQVGWDWFALQFDDGREVMAFRLRRADCQRDPFDHGLLVSAGGGYEALAADRFRLRPVRWWQPAERTGAAPQAASGCPGEAPGYPVRWEISLDDEQFEVQAAIEDQRMQTSVPYWEGLTYIYRDGERIGRGFLEMTGY